MPGMSKNQARPVGHGMTVSWPLLRRGLAPSFFAGLAMRAVDQTHACVMNRASRYHESHRTLRDGSHGARFPGISCLATFTKSLRDKRDDPARINSQPPCSYGQQSL